MNSSIGERLEQTQDSDIWCQYYAKALARKHAQRTELAAGMNQSSLRVAVDCGCGTGADIAYLAELGYCVHGFDINRDAVAICEQRFKNNPRVRISDASFERFAYPENGLVLANSSLFFADPQRFDKTWASIRSSLGEGGVFAGDFMGMKDSWATGYRSPTLPLTREQVNGLFDGFDIIRLDERDEDGPTALGRTKHWHMFSVVAIKRA
ncbi:SAM-dependent methyltransferase [Pseudomonas sp. MYb185]|nr:SAM-dependent methyltransferase [Pseudomonas sp. MYb185]